jgi:hypothetical protein
MDEQLSLIVIKTALLHAKELYEITLYDKIISSDYSNEIGFRELCSAIRLVERRIIKLEEKEANE